MKESKQIKIQEAEREFFETSHLKIYEPCDCGSKILHNNGGNYHEIAFFLKEEDKYWFKLETTCELEPEAGWQEVEKKDITNLIKYYADWL
jgi:hypothetical protein